MAKMIVPYVSNAVPIVAFSRRYNLVDPKAIFIYILPKPSHLRDAVLTAINQPWCIVLLKDWSRGMAYREYNEFIEAINLQEHRGVNTVNSVHPTRCHVPSCTRGWSNGGRT